MAERQERLSLRFTHEIKDKNGEWRMDEKPISVGYTFAACEETLSAEERLRFLFRLYDGIRGYIRGGE